MIIYINRKRLFDDWIDLLIKRWYKNTNVPSFFDWDVSYRVEPKDPVYIYIQFVHYIIIELNLNFI